MSNESLTEPGHCRPIVCGQLALMNMTLLPSTEDVTHCHSQLIQQIYCLCLFHFTNYWDHNDDKMHDMIIIVCSLASRSVLDMLSCPIEVIQEPAIAVAAVVGHKRRQNELPALAPLLVSHLVVVVVGLHSHKVVDHPGHLLNIVLFVKHATVQDGKDLFPPRLLDIVLNNVHHFQSVLLVIK